MQLHKYFEPIVNLLHISKVCNRNKNNNIEKRSTNPSPKKINGNMNNKYTQIKKYIPGEKM